MEHQAGTSKEGEQNEGEKENRNKKRRIQTEKENETTQYINQKVQEQAEVCEYFKRDPITDTKRLKDGRLKITVHCEGINDINLVQVLHHIGVVKLDKKSTGGRYINAELTIHPDALNEKLNIPKAIRRNKFNINALFNNADIITKVEASTQTIIERAEANTQTTIQDLQTTMMENENENNILTLVPPTPPQPIRFLEPPASPSPVEIPELKENTTITKCPYKIPGNIYHNNQTIINCTEVNIPEQILHILGMGPKFCAPINKKQEKLYFQLEAAATYINMVYGNPKQTNEINEEIKELITEYKNEKEKYPHDNETQEFYDKATTDTIRFIQKHKKEIIVCQADKMKKTIVMDRNTYRMKMQQHLNNKEIYTKLENTSINAYIRINEKYLQYLKKTKYITEKEYYKAIAEETKVANIYGQIKTHKQGNPIRPITNTRDTPGYLIAKTVARIIKGATKKDKYNVKNTMEVVEKIKETAITPSMNIYSYDVISMFTNVSFQNVAMAIDKRYTQKTIETKIPCQLMKDMIKFVCVTNTEFAFEDTYYKQVTGLRMGSPSSPISADMVMEDLLDKIFTTTEKPQFFVKYVDDLLTITKEEHAQEIFEKLNEIEPKIKFERETENEEGKINYLEVTLTNKHDTTIECEWYHKAQSSRRILNYLTSHDKRTIDATAQAYVDNMLKITDKNKQGKVIDKAKEILKINSYPEGMIRQIIRTAWSRDTKKETTRETEAEITGYTTGLPYIPNITQTIRKKLNETIDKGIPSCSTNPLNISIFNKNKNLSNKGTNNPEIIKRKPITNTQTQNTQIQNNTQTQSQINNGQRTQAARETQTNKTQTQDNNEHETFFENL